MYVLRRSWMFCTGLYRTYERVHGRRICILRDCIHAGGIDTASASRNVANLRRLIEWEHGRST